MGLVRLTNRSDGSYFCLIGFTQHMRQSIDIGGRLLLFGV